MIRKEKVIKEKLVFNTEYFVAQDYRFWVDCIPYLNFGYIPEKLVNYRLSPNSITKRSYKDKEKFNRRLELINDIHKAAFDNVNVQIKYGEIKLFNEIFNETIYIQNRNFERISEIYRILKSYGNKKSIDYDSWMMSLDRAILMAMSNSNEVSLFQAISFYFKNIEKKTFDSSLVILSFLFSKLRRKVQKYHEK